MNCLRIRILSLGCLTALSSVACACEREQHIRITNDADRELGVDLTVPARTEALIRFKKIKDLGVMDMWKKAMLYDLEAHNKVMKNLKEGKIQAALDIIKKEHNLFIYGYAYIEEAVKHNRTQNDLLVINQLIQELINHGLDANGVWRLIDSTNWPSHHIGGLEYHLDIFLKNGANPNKVIEISKGKFITPLLSQFRLNLTHEKTSVYSSGYCGQVETLLKAGADVNQVVTVREGSQESWTPLLVVIYMCRNNSSFVNSAMHYIDLLLKAGANVNQQAIPCPYDENCCLHGAQTPLSLAFNLGLTEIVKVLLEHGATL